MAALHLVVLGMSVGAQSGTPDPTPAPTPAPSCLDPTETDCLLGSGSDSSSGGQYIYHPFLISLPSPLPHHRTRLFQGREEVNRQR